MKTPGEFARERRKQLEIEKAKAELIAYRDRKVNEYMDTQLEYGLSSDEIQERLSALVDKVIADMAIHFSHE